MLFRSVFVLSPVEPRWAEDPTGYMLALLGVAGLLLGAKLPEALHFAPREVAVSEKVCRRALKALMLLGLIGLGCKVFDSVALRGVDFTDNAVNAREQLGRGETNAFAVAAAALIPMGNAALLFGWYAKATGAVRRIGLTTWAVAAAPGVLSILLASRSALLIFGCLIFAAWLNLAPRIRAWHFAALAGAGAAATTLFAVPWPAQGFYSPKALNVPEDLRGLSFRSYGASAGRFAELAGMRVTTIQAAELVQALASGRVNSMISSGSTGYDAKIWEHVKFFYDVQAWLPKNMVMVNQRAWASLDDATRAAVAKDRKSTRLNSSHT